MASWNPGETGVVWSVDKGGAVLKSGVLVSGSASFDIARIEAKAGDALYFTVAPYGNQSCDTTSLKVTVSGYGQRKG